jgi:transposase
MLSLIKENICKIEGTIAKVEQQIDKQTALYATEIELLQTIPGVGKSTAVGIIAEIGANMDVFPNGQHLASWAGTCPGNNESAGKKKVQEQPRGTNT